MLSFRESECDDSLTEIPLEDDQEEDDQEVKRIVTVRFTVRAKNPNDERGPPPPLTNLKNVSFDSAYSADSLRRRATSRYSVYINAGFNSTLGKLVISESAL